MLPNSTKFTYTGSKVVSFDNSQHYAIGIVPDVVVDKTIEGIMVGRDEYLEKATEIIS